MVSTKTPLLKHYYRRQGICGSEKKSRKIPAKFPTKLLSPKSKNQRRASAGPQGEEKPAKIGQTKGSAKNPPKISHNGPKKKGFRCTDKALIIYTIAGRLCQAKYQGKFQTGGFPDLDLSFLFGPSCPFWDFPELSGVLPIFREFSRLVLFLFLGLKIRLKTPMRNSRERVCDAIRTLPETNMKHPQRAWGSKRFIPARTHEKTIPPCTKFPFSPEIVIRTGATLNISSRQKTQRARGPKKFILART